MAKRWMMSLATLLMLVGCGTAPTASILSADGVDPTFDAEARRKFSYGLGADISGDPGVKLDESYSIQALPAAVDLRAGCSPVANQGQFGSCTSFATIKGLEEFLLKKAHRFVPQAPAFLWYQSRRQVGKKAEDTGVPTEFAMKMLDAYGSLPEAEFPYLEESKQKDETARLAFLTRQPDADQVEAAKKNRIVTGLKTVTKLSAIRNSLAEGMPVVVAMMVFDSIGKTGKDGLLPMPKKGDKMVGGHAVLCVGYDTTKRVLIIRNSWGAGWADGGYFYMPYEYLKYGFVRLAVVPKT